MTVYILKMFIKILNFSEFSAGNNDNIHIYEGDEPLILAKEFCLKHKLDSQVVSVLQEKIKFNRDVALTELRAKTTESKVYKEYSDKIQDKNNSHHNYSMAKEGENLEN